MNSEFSIAVVLFTPRGEGLLLCPKYVYYRLTLGGESLMVFLDCPLLTILSWTSLAALGSPSPASGPFVGGRELGHQPRTAREGRT